MGSEQEDRSEQPSGADDIYVHPAVATEQALRIAADSRAADADRAEALWTLGRGAYYANRIQEAVDYLEEAVGLAAHESLRAEILLTLAPALSKCGRPGEAVKILDDPRSFTDHGWAGQLKNQRAIILTEQGDLATAYQEFGQALELHRRADDQEREARTLVNLGAVASMMGRLADATNWYQLARDLTARTGQEVVAAGIEGNLGYVEGRRGNFAAAIEWYRKARKRFDGFGDVELLTANLELDHARTLLDVGLNEDAIEAAQRSVQSAAAGQNRMLETQARLALGEAYARVSELRAAQNELQQSAAMAAELDQLPLELQASYVSALLADEPAYGPAVVELAQRFVESGWLREAFDVVMRSAMAMRTSDPAQSMATLEYATQLSNELDPIDAALADLLRADLNDDMGAAQTAFDAGLQAIATQRALIGSAEMRTSITSRLSSLTDVALNVARRSSNAPREVLRVLEHNRSQRRMPSRSAQIAAEELEMLRDARVALDEAKLAGQRLSPFVEELQRLERAADARSEVELLADSAPVLQAGFGFLTFTQHGNDMLALVRRGATTSLRSVRNPEAAVAALAAQKQSLRRLADERRTTTDTDLESLRQASVILDDELLGDLDLDCSQLVITPGTRLQEVAWGALPSLGDKRVTITDSLTAWHAGEAQRVDRCAFLAGPNLASSSREFAANARVWSTPTTVIERATRSDVLDAVAAASLVHISAHGQFRSDNPFFSSIELHDGPVTILDFAILPALPGVMLLASCEAGSAETSSAVGDRVVGAAIELRHLGVPIVVAPIGMVNDAAAANILTQLHAELAVGTPADSALARVRQAANASGDARLIGCASSMQIVGNRAASEPIRSA